MDPSSPTYELAVCRAASSLEVVTVTNFSLNRKIGPDYPVRDHKPQENENKAASKTQSRAERSMRSRICDGSTAVRLALASRTLAGKRRPAHLPQLNRLKAAYFGVQVGQVARVEP